MSPISSWLAIYLTVQMSRSYQFQYSSQGYFKCQGYNKSLSSFFFKMPSLYSFKYHCQGYFECQGHKTFNFILKVNRQTWWLNLDQLLNIITNL